jgi:prepilin-type N-terminal cleavage/methylation domain-containing protein
MKKGFTLLELLIVIGILAILSTTMILVINPAEMLRKARDSQRIADLSTVKSAIAYYITSVGTPSIATTTAGYSYSHVSTVTGCTGAATGLATSSQAVDGTGWIPVNFATITGGSPIGSLPVDPNPTAANPTTTKARYYVYTASTTDNTFELLANMESIYYSYGGDGDVESKDGGATLLTRIYEVGTRLNIITASSASCFSGDGT